MSVSDQSVLFDTLNALDSGIVVLDKDQKITYWNAWLASASGRSSEVVLGKTLSEIFPDMSLPRMERSISEALQLGSSSFLTFSLNSQLLPLRTRAGLPLVHNISVRPIGRAPYLNCVLQVVDVTLAAQRERILRERQNARYDAVVANAPDIILTLDDTGQIWAASPSAIRELGYSHDELEGRPLASLFEDAALWMQAWSELAIGVATLRRFELTALRKDQTRIFLEVSASRWSSDGRHFITAILRDVSERRAAEEALHELNQTLERRVAETTQERDRIWRASRDMLGVANLEGIWLSINPAWTRILGWQAEAIVGQTSGWLEHPAASDSQEDAFSRLAAIHRTFTFEQQLRTHEGNYRTFSWTAVSEGGLLYCVGRDITEQKQQQDALNKAEDALRQSQKMEAVGQLTGGLAHDFNNMLAGISGSLELLDKRISQARYNDVERYLAMARGATNRAAALTHRLLAFSRRQTLEPKTIDVNLLISEMRELIKNTVGPTIETSIVEAKPLWSTLVDPNQLENALLNLCINARDAMPKGGTITIQTRNHSFDATDAHEKELAPGDYVEMSVTDTGTGMSSEVISHAFDPFYTTKPLGQGTGLGLSMIYGFAKQSGGQVRITSAIGQGTTVHLFLPRHEHAALDSSVIAASSNTPRATADETVLIVDDEPAIRMLVGEVLSELGYTAIESSDGAGALRVLRSDAQIDLLITDVGLPGGVNGRQVADFGRLSRPTLKVLFITGYAEKTALAGVELDSGMGILPKPFAMEVLATRIEGLLRN